jgi:hypothetical protein
VDWKNFAKKLFAPNAFSWVFVALIMVSFIFSPMQSWPRPRLSPIFGILFSPASAAEIISDFLIFVVALLLFVIYSNLLGLFVRWLWGHNRYLFAFGIVFTIFLLGLEEPVVRAIDRPDYSCSYDADCVSKEIKDGWCGGERTCVNSNWDLYHAPVGSVYALSCAPPPIQTCACIEQKCVVNVIYIFFEGKRLCFR